jgi:dTDP-4-dehydrorhamnose reductase
MRKILILGASGLLGSRLLHSIDNSYGTYFSSLPSDESNFYHLDALNTNELDVILKEVRPDVVINCIGLTNVDECEKFREKSWMLNCSLPVDISKICKLKDIKFVHISTDHYNNLSGTKLTEIDDVSLPNHYSFTKFSAEKMIKEVNPDAIIIRTNFFHFDFESPKTFLDELIVNNSKKIGTKSFNDILFSPVSTSILILYLQKLLELNFCGLISIASDEVLSKYDFHQMILDCLGLDRSLHAPISVNEIKLYASRPKYMALSNHKLLEITKIPMPRIYDMIMEEIRAK